MPWPEGRGLGDPAGAVAIHLGYKLAQAMAYSRGAFTVVYPVVRGTGPLVTVLAAGWSSASTTRAVQWVGVLLLSGGILALSAVNLRGGADRAARGSPQALGWALVTGVFVAAYTTYDAYGIRATPDPFTFLAWFFLLDGLIFPWIALARCRAMADPPALGPLLRRGRDRRRSSPTSASARSCWPPASTRSGRRRCCARPRWSSRR